MKAKSIDRNTSAPEQAEWQDSFRFSPFSNSWAGSLKWPIEIRKDVLADFETHVYTVTAYFGNWTKISFVKVSIFILPFLPLLCA